MKAKDTKIKIYHLDIDMIRPYLCHTINDPKTRRRGKIQLTIQINFISSKDSEETRTMGTKSHNMMGNLMP